MKLGIINGWDEPSIKYVRDKGLDAVEFCVNHNYDSAEVLSHAGEIASYLKTYNVSCGAIGRWGQVRLDETGKVVPEALQHDKNIIDLAASLGCPVVNVGCNGAKPLPYSENLKFATEYFATLLDYAAPKGVDLAVYNCDWANFVYCEKAWSYVLNQLPKLGIKYDTSHCINRHGDYLQEMRDWGNRFYHFHIKGTMYVGGVHYDDPPAGLDDVKWGPVFNLLYTSGYNRMVSIEPHSGRWSGVRGQWGVDFTIQFIRQFLMPENYSWEGTPYMP